MSFTPFARDTDREMSEITTSKRAAGGDGGEEHTATASSTPDAGGGGSSSPPSKRPRANEEAASPGARRSEDHSPPPPSWKGPRKIVTFNVNGGIPRMTKDWPEIDAFVTKETPDLIVFQEVCM